MLLGRCGVGILKSRASRRSPLTAANPTPLQVGLIAKLFVDYAEGIQTVMRHWEEAVVRKKAPMYIAEMLKHTERVYQQFAATEARRSCGGGCRRVAGGGCWPPTSLVCGPPLPPPP